jgi:hypothetical protein
MLCRREKVLRAGEIISRDYFTLATFSWSRVLGAMYMFWTRVTCACGSKHNDTSMHWPYYISEVIVMGMFIETCILLPHLQICNRHVMEVLTSGC